MACENATKAIVMLTYSDSIQERIISSKPPVSVLLEQHNENGKKIYIRGTAYNSSCNPLPNYEEFRGTVSLETQVALVQLPGGTCPSGVQYAVQNAGGSTGTEWIAESVSLREEPFYKGCQIKVIDLTGTIYQKNAVNQQCPTYKISCDNDCPEGEMKCECNAYPGYCCISCLEIKAEIQSTTAMVRTRKRG